MELERVMGAAREASLRAYAPYSGFRVGAAILTEGGALHSGCNVENASYGLAICAERNAAAAMAFANPEDREIKLVAISSPEAAPCFPCGACRQVLREFGCKEVVVEEEGKPRCLSFDEILPNSFGPEAL
ncbi:MAG: cytidine deaminase [Rubrobacteraceae bacterium]